MFINVNNAVKKYGDGKNAVYALNNTSLEINSDEICVIMGPSGSGKSTLLNVLGGLDSVDSGELVVADETISGLNVNQLTEYRRKSVGFVFQFYNLIMDLTVKEILRL